MGTAGSDRPTLECSWLLSGLSSSHHWSGTLGWCLCSGRVNSSCKRSNRHCAVAENDPCSRFVRNRDHHHSPDSVHSHYQDGIATLAIQRSHCSGNSAKRPDGSGEV